MDVLDALSFRLMVIDHIKKNALANPDAMLSFGPSSAGDEGSGEAENLVKEQMQKEINRLIY